MIDVPLARENVAGVYRVRINIFAFASYWYAIYMKNVCHSTITVPRPMRSFFIMYDVRLPPVLYDVKLSPVL